MSETVLKKEMNYWYWWAEYTTKHLKSIVRGQQISVKNSNGIVKIRLHLKKPF